VKKKNEGLMKLFRVPWPVIGLMLAFVADAQAPKHDGPSSTVWAGESPPPASPLALWYRQPARRWLEALPVGNGRLGAMVFGGVRQERLALDEDTFWSGAPSENHENPGALDAFTQIRKLFKAGKYGESAPLIDKLLGRELNYGTSLPAGDLWLTQLGTEGEIRDYRRELDLDQAVARVTFTANGVRFRREVLASHPDGIIVVRLSADRPGAITFTLQYQGGRFPWSAEVRGKDTLAVSGHAFEGAHSDNKSGVAFQGLFRVLPEGGTVTAETHALHVAGADAVTVLIALNTDFHGRDLVALCGSQIAAAQRKNWAALRERHVADYQRLFRRVTIDLGGAERAGTPTDVRRTALGHGHDDPQLAALFFQYGRYLTIAGSREDSPLPMHLQGIWNDGLAADMGWTCDYHLDINTEQNYWLTEVANLSECGQPLFRLIESLQAPGRRTARKMYGIDRGWVCHVFTDAWGYTAPGWGRGWGLHVTAGVWISTHLWEHYLFTNDRDFLARRAYPVLKGAAEFFLDYLYLDPTTGCLMTGPSVSPERGGETGPGPTHDRALVYELFSECIEASRTLNVDADFRARLQAARAKLPPYKIGRNGQLQEWFHRDDGGETEHRHTSHLVGLFPLAQITPRGTPALARAADKSLQLRLQHPGWEDVEWSAGNSVCYYARLGNGELAHKRLLQLLAADTDADLLTFSRGGIAGAAQNIFAIDGNMSGAAGLAEMLLQSDADEIDLLPALPKAWPNGSVKGLCARGGFEVDLEWKNGTLTSATIHNRSGSGAKVRYGDRTIPLTIAPGQAVTLDGHLQVQGQQQEKQDMQL
jgi:alpha-L-fucosidase 2